MQAGKRTVLVTAFHDKGDLYKALGRSPLHYDWCDPQRWLVVLHAFAKSYVACCKGTDAILEWC